MELTGECRACGGPVAPQAAWVCPQCREAVHPTCVADDRAMCVACDRARKVCALRRWGQGHFTINTPN